MANCATCRGEGEYLQEHGSGCTCGCRGRDAAYVECEDCLPDGSDDEFADEVPAESALGSLLNHKSVTDKLPEVLEHAEEWLKHLRSEEMLMRHTAADNLERVIQTLASALEQHGTALCNLNLYVLDLQAAVEALMKALCNAHHPAYQQGRAVLERGGK